MNYGLHGDGTGWVGGLLVLGFLTLLAFMCGFILVFAAKGKGRIFGYYLIVAAILMAIVALLIYSSTRRDLW